MLAELRLFFIDPQTGGFLDLVWKAVISVSNFPDKSCILTSPAFRHMYEEPLGFHAVSW
jgi:hypothetical protein